MRRGSEPERKRFPLSDPANAVVDQKIHNPDQPEAGVGDEEENKSGGKTEIAIRGEQDASGIAIVIEDPNVKETREHICSILKKEREFYELYQKNATLILLQARGVRTKGTERMLAEKHASLLTHYRIVQEKQTICDNGSKAGIAYINERITAFDEKPRVGTLKRTDVYEKVASVREQMQAAHKEAETAFKALEEAAYALAADVNNNIEIREGDLGAGEEAQLQIEIQKLRKYIDIGTLKLEAVHKKIEVMPDIEHSYFEGRDAEVKEILEQLDRMEQKFHAALQELRIRHDAFVLETKGGADVAILWNQTQQELANITGRFKNFRKSTKDTRKAFRPRAPKPKPKRSWWERLTQDDPDAARERYRPEDDE